MNYIYTIVLALILSISPAALVFGQLDNSNSRQDEPVAFNSALTIYNNNFALVKEPIDLNLKDGFNDVSYDGATMLLEPTSVVLEPIFGDENDDYRHEENDYKPKIVITEQSYRNDILSPSYMLSLFEGKTIDFLVESAMGQREVVLGKIIRSGYGNAASTSGAEPIIEVGGKLRFGVPGDPLFPSLGDNTLLKPRLEWNIFSTEPFSGKAILYYLTGGLSWQASYNIVLPETGDLADFSGLVSLNNTSGRDFLDISIELMAGTVNRVVDSGYRSRKSQYEQSAMMSEAMPPGAITQKAFDEYHLYTLPVAVTLRDKEVKQVEFISAKNVMVETIYRVVGQELFQGGGFYDAPDITLSGPTQVSVLRRIINSDSNQLGIPLPAGTVRLYRRDEDSLQFIGENSITHTPKNESIEIVTGRAFDVLAKRVRTQFDVGSYVGSRTMVESFEYTLTNRKSEAVQVQIVDYLRGPNWVIKSESHPHAKTSATEVQWEVEIEKDSETKLTYTVEYKW